MSKKKIVGLVVGSLLLLFLVGYLPIHFYSKKQAQGTQIQVTPSQTISPSPTQTPEPQSTEEATQQAPAKPKPVYQPTSEPTPEPTNTQNPPSNSQNQTDYNNCIQIVIDNYNKGVAETNRSIDEYITRCGSLPNAEACIEGFLTLRISQLQEWEMFNNNGIAQCAARYPH